MNKIYLSFVSTDNNFITQGSVVENQKTKSMVPLSLYRHYKEYNIVEKAMFYLRKWKEEEK